MKSVKGDFVERSSLIVDRIREAEKALTGWSNKGGESLPMRSLLTEAADEIERLKGELEHWKGANLYPFEYRKAVERLHEIAALAQAEGSEFASRIYAEATGV